ncbi:MAG: FAD/NAD(P)-binding protein [Acidimicrobiales bacterium]|jgi:uncharacterized NAD(P)/FAD-binding protein YdhS
MPTRPDVVAVIGGGASGVLAAVHLQRAAREPVRVVIVEPRAELGRGIAYGTTDPGHLLNVRAGCLSALPEEPGHFTAWARRHTDADTTSFLPRTWYGEYLRSLLEPVEHVPARAEDLTPVGAGVQIALSDGTRRNVDRVVLAPGSPPPAWPEPLGGNGDRWIGDPWAPGALAEIPPGAPVLLVGTGLSAVDAALTLHGAGHRHIVATSRHGLLPHPHSEKPFPELSIDLPRRPTARALVAWARQTAAEVGDWGPVVDALRPGTDELWGAMTASERKRLLRHVYRRWEVLRHRMAPPVATRIDDMLQSGHLTIVAGAVRSARATPGGIEVTVAGRQLRFGAVVNCTGPSADVRRTRHPLVRRLLDRGVAHPGPLALGLDTDEHGSVPGTHDALWVVGPLRRGQRWETTAIPEIRAQAADLALSLWRSDELVVA